MSCFEMFNPATVFIFFTCVIVSGIFTMNPVITVISLAGAVLLWIVMPGRKNKKIHIFVNFSGKRIIHTVKNSPLRCVDLWAEMYFFF